VVKNDKELCTTRSRDTKSSMLGHKLGLVHTTPKKFENAALFLRLDLPSTLIRHENEAFFSNALFKLEEFENARFFVFVSKENILKTELFKNEGVTIVM